MDDALSIPLLGCSPCVLPDTRTEYQKMSQGSLGSSDSSDDNDDDYTDVREGRINNWKVHEQINDFGESNSNMVMASYWKESDGDMPPLKYSSGEDEATYSADEDDDEDGGLDDEWLDSGSAVNDQLRHEEQQWTDEQDDGIDEQWSSTSSEVEQVPTSSTDSEMEWTEEESQPEERKEESTKISPLASTIKPNQEPGVQRILCFDEYGNLTTTYCKPEAPPPPEPPSFGCGPMEISFRGPQGNNQIEESSEEDLDDVSQSSSVGVARNSRLSTCNGESKSPRKKGRVRHESRQETGQEVAVSDQEIQQAFKEEGLIAAATSRYGRARKRKQEDGFYFGTLNFNELRRITGSPKKKGTNSKSGSPEQKSKLPLAREEIKSGMATSERADALFNGLSGEEGEEEEEEEEEEETAPTSSKVQSIVETKDDTLVQNVNKDKEENAKHIVNEFSSFRNKFKDSRAKSLSITDEAHLDYANHRTADETSEKENRGLKDFSMQNKKLALRDRGDSSDSAWEGSLPSTCVDKRRRLSLQKQPGESRRRRPSTRHRPVIEASDRILRGNSDVLRIKASLQESENVVAYRRRSRRLSLDVSTTAKGVVDADTTFTAITTAVSAGSTTTSTDVSTLTAITTLSCSTTTTTTVASSSSVAAVGTSSSTASTTVTEPDAHSVTEQPQESISANTKVQTPETSNASKDSQDIKENESPTRSQPVGRPRKTRSLNQSKPVDAIEIDQSFPPTTKSGRLVRKTQLMDMSDLVKQQKMVKEQLKENAALSNLSFEEELKVLGLDVSNLEKEIPCDHMVGDLVWVHIRGNPFWPAMISYHPELGQFTKITLIQSVYRIRSQRLYHVQFFSDNAQTSWIRPVSILPFEGLDKLKEHVIDLQAKVKDLRKNKRQQTEALLRTLTNVEDLTAQKTFKHERWLTALTEATLALKLNRYERIQRYALQEPEPARKEERKSLSGSTVRNSCGRIKKSTGSLQVKPENRTVKQLKKNSRQSEPLSVEQMLFASDSADSDFSGFGDHSSNESKKKKKNIISRLALDSNETFKSYCQKNIGKLLLENPELTEDSARKKLRWKWRKLTSLKTSRHKSKVSAGDEGGSASDVDMNALKEKYLASVCKSEGRVENGVIAAKRKRADMDLDGDNDEEEVSLKGVYKVVRNEKVCYICEGVSNKSGGADMIRCKGLCYGVFHLRCVGLSFVPKKDFRCNECATGKHTCFLCKSSEGIVHRCSISFCGKYYHDECVQKWPQVSKLRQERFVCPRHVCHMCAANADDMGDPVARNPPFTRCLRCPTTYHTGEECIAAGSEEVSQNHHICTKHLSLSKNNSHHVNVNWCFCCSKGGSLLLCDQCPAAFHADCMKITAPEGGYVCEDCENGKFPVYGDIVWVKLGIYRWWPGQVLHPRYIPDNIENLAHNQGMFCVHFFGSNDYYWVTRGRTFHYQEGDKGSKASSSKTLGMQFQRAIDEAMEAYRAQRAKKAQREAQRSEKGNLKPPPYARIDSNRPVGNVRLNKLDLAAVNRCDCDPHSENPCGSDAKCLNRMLMFECVREVCGAGYKCGNQRFQRRQYPKVCTFRTEGRGWGLKTRQDIRKGDFVIEYVGELIDDEEFRRRIEQMHQVKEENYYFLTIDKDIMIDAGPKGNLARFMNHSCQPNCETQKWTVGGDTRVGLFALHDVPAGSELTFNYNLECVGTEKKKCHCGAPNCSGYIGVKVQKPESLGPKKDKLGKRKRKRRRREMKLSEDECFRCGGVGDLILCDVAACPKGYHLQCLSLNTLPKGKWICPWHHCDECGQRTSRQYRCGYCPNSFCRQHNTGNLQQLSGLGLICNDHDPEELEALRGQMEQTAATENETSVKCDKSDDASNAQNSSECPSADSCFPLDIAQDYVDFVPQSWKMGLVEKTTNAQGHENASLAITSCLSGSEQKENQVPLLSKSAGLPLCKKVTTNNNNNNNKVASVTRVLEGHKKNQSSVVRVTGDLQADDDNGKDSRKRGKFSEKQQTRIPPNKNKNKNKNKSKRKLSRNIAKPVNLT